MAAVWNTTVTNLGLQLQTKQVQGSTIAFTRAVSGSGSVPVVNLREQTAVSEIKQTLNIQSLTVGELQYTLKILLTNLNLTNGYNLSQVGIYATDPDLGEILFAIAQLSDAKAIPSQTDAPGYSLLLSMTFQNDQGANIEINPDMSGYITMSAAQDMINDATDPILNNLEELTTDVQNINTNIGTKDENMSIYSFDSDNNVVETIISTENEDIEERLSLINGTNVATAMQGYTKNKATALVNKKASANALKGKYSETTIPNTYTNRLYVYGNPEDMYPVSEISGGNNYCAIDVATGEWYTITNGAWTKQPTTLLLNYYNKSEINVIADTKVDKYIDISQAIDLNTILETGFYSIPNGCTNIPAMAGGGKATLIVIVHPYGASSGQILQILVNQLNVNSTDKMYYRIGTIGTQAASFLDWNRVLNLDDIPTIASAIKQWNTGTYTIDLYGIGLPDLYYPASSTYSEKRYLDVNTGIMYDCEQTGPDTYTWHQAPVNLRLKTDINASAIEELQEDISTSQTASGNPLTIESSESNLVECTAEVECVQEGSGDPSPTNVRPIIGQTEVVIGDVGVNQWDEEWELGAILGGTGENASSSTKIRSVNYIPIFSDTTYYYKHSSTESDLFFYDENKTYIDYISKNTSGTFTTPNNARYVRFSILQTTYNNNISINYPSTDTDYHAYKRKTYRVEIGQKNKLPMTVDGIKSANTDGTWNGNVYSKNNGTFEILTDSDDNVIGIKVNGTFNETTPLNLVMSEYATLTSIGLTSGTTYTINGCPQNGSFYDLYSLLLNAGNTSNKYDEGSGFNITVNDSDTYMIQVYIRSGYNAQNLIFYPMIRLATETDSTFVPYNPNLPDAIYGSELDILTGKLRVDRASYTFDGTESWILQENAKRVYTNVLSSVIAKPLTSAIVANILSNMYYAITSDQSYIGVLGISVNINGTVEISDGTGEMDVNNWKAFLSDNNLQVVYELATPYTIQLTPQQIRLLKGTNNISCNTGDLTIKYYPDNVLGQLKGDIEDEIDAVANRIKGVKTMQFSSKMTTDDGQLFFDELENAVIVGAEVYEDTFRRMGIPFMAGNSSRLKVVDISDLSAVSYKSVKGTIYYHEI